ncbi:N-6 DNA methylase [Clostridium sp.]|uniref:N-6 DNA methylase n=1 Tax=Clostridium sp. TaxID=1506 RepID=UPI0029142416|nr:N-6 DNA methylase [Clostridium sp.]MDU7240409.1 N-6 DNA methylase [Clostridium sp.]
MRRISLIADIFRGVNSFSNISKKRLLIAAVTSIKVILDNKERLNVNTYKHWFGVSLDVNKLIDTFKELRDITDLDCFKDEEGIEVLKSLKDSDFDKLINLINNVVDSSDIISYCKELRLTANVEGKMYDYTTDYRVLDIPIKIIDPSIEDTFVDYFNGESGVELQLMEHFKLKDKDGYKLKYFGEEINDDTFAIGQLINFLITGNIERIKKGDSLKDPSFVDYDELIKFDVAISNPPFMRRLNDEDIIRNDTYNRFKYGISEKNLMSTDWVIVSQLLNSIKENGKAAILLPIGALFRLGAEERVRRNLVSEDLIEAIIRVPSSVLSYTNIVTCWVIFNKNKEARRRNKIQFIDLTNFVESIDRRNNTISIEGVEKATEAYREFEEDEISFILDERKLDEKNYDLNAFDYIKSERLKESFYAIEMTEFKNIASIRRGVQVNKGKLDALNTGDERTHYLISIGNIVDGKIVVDESDKIQIERKWERVYDVEKGDLLVTSKGTQFKVAIVEENINAIISANLFIIRPYKDKYLPEVLKYYLESELGQELVQGIIKGTSIKSISHKDIQELSIPKIDMEKQKYIAVRIKSSKENYERRVKEALEIFNEEQEKIKRILNFSIE